MPKTQPVSQPAPTQIAEDEAAKLPTTPTATASRRGVRRLHQQFEQEQEDFFKGTRAEYLRRAAEFSSRFRVIDSTRPIAEIQQDLDNLISELCKKNSND